MGLISNNIQEQHFTGWDNMQTINTPNGQIVCGDGEHEAQEAAVKFGIVFTEQVQPTFEERLTAVELLIPLIAEAQNV